MQVNFYRSLNCFSASTKLSQCIEQMFSDTLNAINVFAAPLTPSHPFHSLTLSLSLPYQMQSETSLLTYNCNAAWIFYLWKLKLKNTLNEIFTIHKVLFWCEREMKSERVREWNRDEIFVSRKVFIDFFLFMNIFRPKVFLFLADCIAIENSINSFLPFVKSLLIKSKRV